MPDCVIRFLPRLVTRLAHAPDVRLRTDISVFWTVERPHSVTMMTDVPGRRVQLLEVCRAEFGRGLELQPTGLGDWSLLPPLDGDGRHVQLVLAGRGPRRNVSIALPRERLRRFLDTTTRAVPTS